MMWLVFFFSFIKSKENQYLKKQNDFKDPIKFIMSLQSELKPLKQIIKPKTFVFLATTIGKQFFIGKIFILIVKKI